MPNGNFGKGTRGKGDRGQKSNALKQKTTSAAGQHMFSPNLAVKHFGVNHLQ